MSATLYVTDISTVIGTTTRNAVGSMVGEFFADFDMDALEAAYIEYIAGFLPDGYSISGRAIYRIQGSTGPLDPDTIRTALHEDTDGFDIRPYALGSEDTDPVETITMRTIGQLSKTDPVVYIAELADPHQKRLIVSADQYNRLGKPETITVTITPTSY